jgi:D-alanine-D-alanine ligase
MRVALTHNLRVSADSTEARYAPPETVDGLVASLTRLGNEVVPVEVSGPVADTITRLRDCAPDVVYNISEGWPDGPGQEFFPALFSHLGYPHTGSDAAVLTLAIDKHLTKLVLRAQGVRTPRWQFLREPEGYDPDIAGFPAIVKPNSEGTSRGITQESVVDSASAARTRIKLLLCEYPAGVLVEQYVAGRDVSVDYLEAVDNAFGGVMTPQEIEIQEERSHNILDYGFKNFRYRMAAEPEPRVRFHMPPRLPDDVIEQIRGAALASVTAVGLVDIATVDFRVDDADVPYVLEVNALPRLDPDLVVRRGESFAGVRPEDAVVAAVLVSATRRYGLPWDVA